MTILRKAVEKACSGAAEVLCKGAKRLASVVLMRQIEKASQLGLNGQGEGETVKGRRRGASAQNERA